MGNELDIRSNKLHCDQCGEPMRVGRMRDEFTNLNGNLAHKIDERITAVSNNSPPGHNHDSNCVTRRYICQAGHVMVVSKLTKCPACDWVQHSTCGCHDGDKQNEWPDI